MLLTIERSGYLQQNTAIAVYPYDLSCSYEDLSCATESFSGLQGLFCTTKIIIFSGYYFELQGLAIPFSATFKYFQRTNYFRTLLSEFFKKFKKFSIYQKDIQQVMFQTNYKLSLNQTNSISDLGVKFQLKYADSNKPTTINASDMIQIFLCIFFITLYF